MNRLILCWVAAVGMVGCQTPPPNPFLNTTVPPPGTGAAAGVQTPYYGPPGAAPAFTAPGGIAPGPAGVPDQQFLPPQSSIDRTKVSMPVAVGGQVGQPGSMRRVSPDEKIALRQPPRVIRPNEVGVAVGNTKVFGSVSDVGALEAAVDRAASAEVDPSSVESTFADTDSPVGSRKLGGAVQAGYHTADRGDVAFSDEDEVDGFAAEFGAESREASDGLNFAPTEASEPAVSIRIRQGDSPARSRLRRSITSETGSEARATVSPRGTDPEGDDSIFDPISVSDSRSRNLAVGSSVGSVATGAARPRYHHDQQYRQLRGKLEYSRATGQWKLRYIPINGESDQFGGSVLLPNSAHLEPYRPGDYVSVQGALSKGGVPVRGYSPMFAFSGIRSQAD